MKIICKFNLTIFNAFLFYFLLFFPSFTRSQFVEKQVGGSTKQWRSIAMSEDGNKLAAIKKYVCTGSFDTYVVPPSVFKINITIAGAEGGCAYAVGCGGTGNIINASLSVTPNNQYYLYVGCTTGFFGGGNSGAASVKGGGASGNIEISIK